MGVEIVYGASSETPIESFDVTYELDSGKFLVVFKGCQGNVYDSFGALIAIAKIKMDGNEPMIIVNEADIWKLSNEELGNDED